jgi:hypothetical protein
MWKQNSTAWPPKWQSTDRVVAAPGGAPMGQFGPLGSSCAGHCAPTAGGRLRKPRVFGVGVGRRCGRGPSNTLATQTKRHATWSLLRGPLGELRWERIQQVA